MFRLVSTLRDFSPCLTWRMEEYWDKISGIDSMILLLGIIIVTIGWVQVPWHSCRWFDQVSNEERLGGTSNCHLPLCMWRGECGRCQEIDITIWTNTFCNSDKYSNQGWPGGASHCHMPLHMPLGLWRGECGRRQEIVIVIWTVLQFRQIFNRNMP